MKIWADFNARTADDRVSLETKGSRESLAKTHAAPGDWVWLTDGDLRVGAQIEETDGKLYARPAWETMEDIIPREDERLAQVPQAEAEQLLASSRSRQGYPPDLVFRLAPYLQESPEKAGHVDYLRARGAETLGYKHLALLAINDAIEKQPNFGPYFHHRVRLLREIDMRRAIQEISPVLAGKVHDVIQIVACIEVLGDRVRTAASPEEALAHDREILRVTENVDLESFAKYPQSFLAQMHLARGLAYSHLGNRNEAFQELDKAVSLNFREPVLLIARGIEGYPSDGSVLDFQQAMKMSAAYYWPGYFLAHHFLLIGEFGQSQMMAEAALRVGPPARVQANLLEWLAISRAEQEAAPEEVRALFYRAMRLAPTQLHIRQNLQAYESLVAQAQSTAPKAWALTRDENPSAFDLVAEAA